MTSSVFAVLSDIEYYLPEYIEDNELLVQDVKLGWSAEDVFKKTGIRQRHIASKNECASDLAVHAVKKLFCRLPDLRDATDFLIFCSQSPDYILPATSCILQKRLGLSDSCGALDINQGCSGFIYGLSVAKGLVECGIATNILLVMAETYSKHLKRDDKTTRIIFGDGAAVAYISGREGTRERIGCFCLGTDGTGADNLIVRNSASRKEIDGSPFLFMDGPEIFQFTLSVVPRTVHRILESAGKSLEEVDYFIFHQANAFMLEHLRMKLNIPKEKFCVDLEEIGNTVSASIPIALQRARAGGRLRAGMLVMLLGFGVGYSWGGCLVRLD